MIIIKLKWYPQYYFWSPFWHSQMLEWSYSLISMVKQSSEGHLSSRTLSIMEPIWAYQEPKLFGGPIGTVLPAEKPWHLLNISNPIAALQSPSKQVPTTASNWKSMGLQSWQATPGGQWSRRWSNWNNVRNINWLLKEPILPAALLLESSINSPKIWAAQSVHPDPTSTPKPANVNAFRTVNASNQGLNGMAILIATVIALSVSVRMDSTWMGRHVSANACSKGCARKDKNGIPKNVHANVKSMKFVSTLWNGILKLVHANVFQRNVLRTSTGIKLYVNVSAIGNVLMVKTWMKKPVHVINVFQRNVLHTSTGINPNANVCVIGSVQKMRVWIPEPAHADAKSYVLHINNWIRIVNANVFHLFAIPQKSGIRKLVNVKINAEFRNVERTLSGTQSCADVNALLTSMIVACIKDGIMQDASVFDCLPHICLIHQFMNIIWNYNL